LAGTGSSDFRPRAFGRLSFLPTGDCRSRWRGNRENQHPPSGRESSSAELGQHLNRSKDNRLDDVNEAVIHKRLETYEIETKPVLGHYDPTLIHKIDATQTPARVLWEILGVITGQLVNGAAEPPIVQERWQPN